MRTEGDIRVVRSFNVSGDSEINWFKEQTAALIDRVTEMSPTDDPYKQRWIEWAAYHYEQAVMNAVKALTHKEIEQLDE